MASNRTEPRQKARAVPATHMTCSNLHAHLCQCQTYVYYSHNNMHSTCMHRPATHSHHAGLTGRPLNTHGHPKALV